MAARIGPRQVGLLCLLVTSVGWGLNWPAMKMLLQEVPPLTARGGAGLVAACGLALLAAVRGERLAVPGRMVPRLVLASAVNVFAWMGFATLSMLWLTAGEAALLVYTMPIWVALLGWPVLGDRPSARSIAALALGIAGIAVLLGGQAAGFGPEKLPGVLLALGSAFLFALGTVGARKPLGLAPLTAVAWQVGIGCLPMVALGLAFEDADPGALSAAGWAALAYMTVIPMGACYLSWFAALRRLPPSTASMATLLTPVIGVLAAAATLGEPFGPRQMLALALTLGGIALAVRRA